MEKEIITLETAENVYKCEILSTRYGVNIEMPDKVGSRKYAICIIERVTSNAERVKSIGILDYTEYTTKETEFTLGEKQAVSSICIDDICILRDL